MIPVWGRLLSMRMCGEYIKSTTANIASPNNVRFPSRPVCLPRVYVLGSRPRRVARRRQLLAGGEDSVSCAHGPHLMLVFPQVDASIVYLEPVYESEEQQAPVGLPNSSPYQPQISGGLVVMSPSPPVYASGSRLPVRCGCGLCGGPEVPQRPYIPVQTSPDLSQPNGETLSFSKGGCGVPLIDAVKNRLSGLVGGDDLMFVEAPVTTFSLRIEVCAYFVLLARSRGIDRLSSGRGIACGRER